MFDPCKACNGHGELRDDIDGVERSETCSECCGTGRALNVAAAKDRVPLVEWLTEREEWESAQEAIAEAAGSVEPERHHERNRKALQAVIDLLRSSEADGAREREFREKYERALVVLADIATIGDMTIELAQQAARRIYRELTGSDPR